jgi:Zn-dependent protease with chaperone function
MILSFAGRLLCVAAVMTGLIHLLLEGFLWLAAPYVLRIAEAVPARRRERLLYTVQLVPTVAAIVLTCAVCIPRYVLNESNHDEESVGWLCVAGALAVGIWYGATLLRGLTIAARTAWFARACRRAANPVMFDREGTPILSYPGTAYSVALVGLFQPFILISENLLGEGGLSRGAIDVVLDHEASHAMHRDNWKLFSLCCVPSLRLRLFNGRTWNEMWRAAAEWAADDDAVRGDSDRVLVLAETLIAVARRGATEPPRVCMALECDLADLAVRVDRLIGRPLARPNHAAAPHARRGVNLAMAAAVALVAATLGVMLSSHQLLEHLLHLGQG